MKNQPILEYAKELMSVLPHVMLGFLSRQKNALAKGQISAPQYLVLEFINRHGAQKMSVLAKTIKISLPAMTKLVDKLYSLNMVKRNYDPKDRRIIKIELSTKGAKQVAIITEQRQQLAAKFFGRLSEHDRQEYLRILKEIRNVLQSTKDEK